MLLESHLLDFSGDVYGAYVSVELLQRLRGEEIFSSNSELKQQIERDINCARQYFDKQNKFLSSEGGRWGCGWKAGILRRVGPILIGHRYLCE
jgi:FAD synthase